MTRHILVVDDNGDVRDVVVMMLIEGGFLATAAPGGVAMRDLMAADRIPFDAIVLDSLMPGEPSAALAMHAKDKKIPVVMISGSIERINFADEHGLQLLRKPFGVDDLLQAVEEAIASGQFGQRDAITWLKGIFAAYHWLSLFRKHRPEAALLRSCSDRGVAL